MKHVSRRSFAEPVLYFTPSSGHSAALLSGLPSITHDPAVLTADLRQFV